MLTSLNTLEWDAPSVPILREGPLCDEWFFEMNDFSVEPVTYPDDTKRISDQRAVKDGTGKRQHRGSGSTSKPRKNSRYRERI